MTIYATAAGAAKALAAKCGGNAALWHVGHSGNPYIRLGQKRVSPYFPLVFVECADGFVADEAERYLVNKLGYGGKAGGGDVTSIFVYAVPRDGLDSLDWEDEE